MLDEIPHLRSAFFLELLGLLFGAAGELAQSGVSHAQPGFSFLTLQFPVISVAQISPKAVEEMGGIPKPLRMLGTAVAVVFGGMFSLSLASSVTIRILRTATEAKRKKVALPCSVCKATGFYTCKLCNGKSTIEWSPMYDPIVINPCLCPTCEGNKVQRCLNCVGKGYV